MSELNTEVFKVIAALGPITFNQLTEELFKDETYDKRKLERKVLFRIIGGLMRSRLISTRADGQGNKVFYRTSAGRNSNCFF